MEGLVKLPMSSLCGESICKDIIEEHCPISQNWMSTEYDERVLDYWNLPTVSILLNYNKTREWNVKQI